MAVSYNGGKGKAKRQNRRAKRQLKKRVKTVAKSRTPRGAKKASKGQCGPGVHCPFKVKAPRVKKKNSSSSRGGTKKEGGRERVEIKTVTPPQKHRTVRFL